MALVTAHYLPPNTRISCTDLHAFGKGCTSSLQRENCAQASD